MNEITDEEVELMDYLRVIWKRKWLIIIPTFICMIIAGIVSFLLPPIWEIDCLIQPSKFFIQTQTGEFKEILLEEPTQIAEKINREAYDNLIAAQLNLSLDEFPKIKAENLRNTNLIRVYIKENNIELAKSILSELITHIKRDLDTKVDLEIKNIDLSIKRNEIEKERWNKEIEILNNKYKIVNQREKEIIEEMKEIRKRIKKLEEEQFKVLNKEGKNAGESLSLLLYSNEIQQNLRYYNSLNELLSAKKIERENINSRIKEIQKKIEQLDNEIKRLEDRKGRYDYTRIVKPPMPSLHPVSPKKKLNIAIAGILSLMIFTILAFFLEYIEKYKVKK